MRARDYFVKCMLFAVLRAVDFLLETYVRQDGCVFFRAIEYNANLSSALIFVIRHKLDVGQCHKF